MPDVDAEPPVATDRLSALPKPTTSAEVRSRLVELLRRDLIGPHPDLDGDLAREVLRKTPPSGFYLAGMIAPSQDAPEAPPPTVEDQAEAAVDELRAEETLGEEATRESDDGDADTSRAKKRSFLPSSIGLTVLLPEGVDTIEARVTWGDYLPEPPLPAALVLPEAAPRQGGQGAEGGERSPFSSELNWRRIPREERLTLTLAEGERDVPVPGSRTPLRPVGADALVLALRVRPVRETQLPDGTSRRTRTVSVFLVNRRARVVRRYTDVATAFQARIELSCTEGFAPRDDLSTYRSEDADERLSDLHYRDVCTFAAGHNVSADWEEGKGGCRRVWTEPLPCEEVRGVTADLTREGVELGMEALAEAASRGGEAVRSALDALPRLYAEWAAAQAHQLGSLPTRRREVAERCLADIDHARRRIEAGLQRLSGDRLSLEAFAIMNRAIARSNRQRASIERKTRPEDLDSPRWRLFQIAFILLNLDGLADRESDDRPVVDLLFFPTGGGKTEAYLGLAAFAIARRRLANPGLTGAGLSVVMRYTLRLLTLDQLSRAAGLICALELERQAGGRLGECPIEIGLWVGGGVTPNRFGSSKDKGERTLVYWLGKMRKGGPTPLPLKACPWCGSDLGPDCFTAKPTISQPLQLTVHCSNARCDFAERLPIVTVDEEVYRRLPAFMIATVDKFANVPWEGRTGAFFGHVDRHDDRGFYGAAEPREGRKLSQELPPIDLVIQDELHLISGPLGTVAGLYETAFDLLASREVNGKRLGPKIVASTATVRRADKQIRALFGRADTRIFPPPGLSRHDSFFAETDTRNPGRLYLGVGAPGQGPKRVFLRTLQTLLSGGAALSSGIADDPADPYLTALCYFNALRELGGARRIVDDEVRRNLSHYGADRVRQSPTGTPFVDRSLHETIELTSRVSTDKVSKARTALGLAARDKGAAHVALATNMISVGLDIPRLGLMVVQGQPKTTAEYIQATSRVGRARGKPGLVVTLLNLHKPRDRTHHEQFRAFHMSFYRAVEATSVTPFASRALDRALAAMLVAAVRHLAAGLTPSPAAEHAPSQADVVDVVRKAVLDKTLLTMISVEEREAVLERLEALREAWANIADEQTRGGQSFWYDHRSPPQRLLQEPLKPLETDLDGRRSWFAAGRSMRETEPSALLIPCRPNGSPLRSRT